MTTTKYKPKNTELPPPGGWWSRRQICFKYHITLPTLRAWIKEGLFPPPIVIDEHSRVNGVGQLSGIHRWTPKQIADHDEWLLRRHEERQRAAVLATGKRPVGRPRKSDQLPAAGA
jgi:hypothetical protein